jgi:uncharacterized repeat protein (TIGR03803 family)
LLSVTVAVAIELLAPARDARAQVPLDVLHEFGATGDGSAPAAALIQTTDGTFYGTTAGGGANSVGTIFKMTERGAVTVMHDFTLGADGILPLTPLLLANDGNFYGTAAFGPGIQIDGTAFRMSPAGTVTVLHTFAGTTDGSVPVTALIQAADGNLYGTTNYSDNGDTVGTIYKMTLDGTETVLHTLSLFQTEGDSPQGALIQAADGNFYGTARYGGTGNIGTIFRIDYAGTLTVMHSFAGSDGIFPTSGLIQATDGNFYGTTNTGGTGKPFGSGTVYRMTADGTVTTLHAFTGGDDGGFPIGPLIQGSDGNLYGTTSLGGAFNGGAIFRVTLDGVLTVLHSFGETPADGVNPTAGLLQGRDGNLYGTTTAGGSFNRGIAFRLNIAPCRDELALAYSGGTLNLGFTLQNPAPATWSVWAAASNSVVQLWSASIPEIEPAASFNVPIGGVPPAGPVGILTTISTLAEGVRCFDWKVVNTGP